MKLKSLDDWINESRSLQFYFNMTEEDNKFELYKFPDSKSGGVSYENVRDEIEKYLDFSDQTATNLENEIIAPIITKEYREQVTKRMKDDGYMRILWVYVSSIFQDFESFLRTAFYVVGDDIRLVLDEFNSSFLLLN